jgi:hypothetical protein
MVLFHDDLRKARRSITWPLNGNFFSETSANLSATSAVLAPKGNGISYKLTEKSEIL